MTPSDLRGIERLVRDHFGERTACANSRRLSGGASRETWSVDAVVSGETIPLIARLDSGDPTPGAGLEREARLLRTAADHGVPVPRVFGAGDWYVLMERIEGETIPRRILRAPPPDLAAQCGAILADLHRMPAQGLDGPRESTGDSDPLEFWRQVLDDCGEPHPVFELAFRRLAASRPVRSRTTVVHGDFRNGNLIVGQEGVRAVLDWELTHLGDPLEDLGWLCVKAWRFGSELPVGGFGTYEELIGAYERASGHRVDRDALRWWETFGTLKWGIICIMQALRHVRGGSRSVELAAIGRRVCETEWDILHAL